MHFPSTISRTIYTIYFLLKVLFVFPSQYLFAIGFVPIFSFRSLPFILGSQTHKQPYSQKSLHGWYTMCHTRDCHPLRCAVPMNLSTVHRVSRRFSRLKFAVVSTRDFKLELFPLHSPLLGGSFLFLFLHLLIQKVVLSDLRSKFRNLLFRARN